MENLKVDNKHLNDMAKGMEDFIKILQKDINFLQDQNADIFNRYMAYNRCKSLIEIIIPFSRAIRFSLQSGHELQNKIFHTQSAIENEWDKSNIENHPFFENECTHDPADVVRDSLLKLLNEVRAKNKP